MLRGSCCVAWLEREGIKVGGVHALDQFGGEEARLRAEEVAEVFLAERAVGCVGAFCGEEFGGDAGAICSGDFDAEPLVIADPFVVEEAALATGSGHDEEGAVGGGEEGTGGAVEGVGDAGGFVDDEERDGGEAADGGFVAGEGDDAGVVGELETEAVAGVGFARDIEGAEEGEDFAEEFAGLAEGGGEDERERVGDVEGLVESADGGSG